MSRQHQISAKPESKPVATSTRSRLLQSSWGDRRDSSQSSQSAEAPPILHEALNLPVHSTDSLMIQPKLKIGAIGDKYEQEADRIAAQVVNQIHTPQAFQQGETIQRQEMNDEEEDKLQMKPLSQSPSGGVPATQKLEAEIGRSRSGGNSLAASIRRPMERAFGADFSSVRVHTDTQADQLNRSIQAKAFTTGQDIFFQQGAYEPGSRGGQELIAHELTHVVQQSGGKKTSSVNKEIKREDGQKIGAIQANNPPNLQRDIGMEYEVQGTHLRNEKNELVTYGDKVYKGEGWYMESDDGRMEFVITHKPTTKEGGEQLCQSTDAAAKFALATINDRPIDIEQVAKTASIGGKVEKKGIKIHTAEGFELTNSLAAKPQASMGIDLERISHLYQKMAKGEITQSAGKIASSVVPEEGTKWEQAVGSYYQNTMNMAEHYTQKEKREQWDKNVFPDWFESKAWTAWLAMVAEYLKAAKGVKATNTNKLVSNEELEEFYGQKEKGLQGLPITYPKAAHALMARTNFGAMLIHLENQELIKLPDNRDEFWNVVCCGAAQLAGRSEDLEGQKYLYPGGYYKDSLDPNHWYQKTEEAKNGIATGPTVQEWLLSIEHDVYKHIEGETGSMERRVAPHVPDTPEKRGMGAMTGHDKEKVGKEKKDRLVPVFEYRLFEGFYEPKQWADLAKLVYEYVLQVNQSEV